MELGAIGGLELGRKLGCDLVVSLALGLVAGVGRARALVAHAAAQAPGVGRGEFQLCPDGREGLCVVEFGPTQDQALLVLGVTHAAPSA